MEIKLHQIFVKASSAIVLITYIIDPSKNETKPNADGFKTFVFSFRHNSRLSIQSEVCDWARECSIPFFHINDLYMQ